MSYDISIQSKDSKSVTPRAAVESFIASLPNLPGEDDYTPLHHAAGADSAKIVRLLLEHGASVSLVDIYGHTPIDYATKQNLELFKRRA